MTSIDSDRQRNSVASPALPGWLLRYRGVLIWLFHMGLAVASSYIAFSVRFDGAIPPRYLALWRDSLAMLLVARGTMFLVFRLYEGLWRYTSVHDLVNILLSVGLSSLMFLAFVHEGLGLSSYPRSILLIDTLLLIAFAGGVRLMARAHRGLVSRSGGKRVLVYGAGDAGEALVREMQLSLSSEYHPVGFVDDDHAKVGQRIHSVPVLGTRDDLARIIKRKRPQEVIVTIPRADPDTYRAVVRVLEPFDVPIKTLPQLRDILGGNVSTSLIRDLSLEDLLRRTPVGLSRTPLLGLVEGKTILVTGAGGSIGSELCRQIAALNPASLIVYERHENSLYNVVKDLTSGGAQADIIHPVIGDVTDRARFRSVLHEHRPHIVFHAAAHKHVPLMEQNICEAVKNNVLGTRVAAELADECGVERFILISTDKAVNPVSVMGATKRVAELMLQSRSSASRTRFVTVRFGNVLGSNGSVVPLFVEQLKRGGPLTVTHPEVRRYFMLIPEAVQLVLHAAAAGESNSIYVLEMGEPIRLLDVARDLIRLSGLKPDEVPITFVGLRPGEKLDEELVGRDEMVRPSAVESVMQVQPLRPPHAAWLSTQIRNLERLAIAGNSAGVLTQLQGIVPEFASLALPPAEQVEAPEAPVETPVDVSVPIPVIPPAYAPARRARHTPARAAASWRTCTACGSESLHRSRVNGPIEQLRRQISERRPYRCYACGWRGWMDVITFPPAAESPDVPPPDLNLLDLAFRPAGSMISRLDASHRSMSSETMAVDRHPN